MAPRKTKSKIVAKIVTGQKLPCGFCNREVDDELTYGKLYAIGDIQCHYFCVLLSSCLVQKGRDMEGLFGFLYEDILAEIERAKKHRCSYCSRGGANLGCSISQCRKQFHLPCGRERNAVSLFYGNYKSFCQQHAPKQSIPPTIMAKAKQRMLCDKKKIKKKDPYFKDLKELAVSCADDDSSECEIQSVCVICYEPVEGYPSVNTFWPSCCARDAWFHRTCLQRMALSAGMHYLKCPLCNDKENFYEAVVTQGYYVPDRDAAWELEQNAFAEIYERDVECSAADCLCPMGRAHDDDAGSWCIKLCLLCGSSGTHAGCTDNTNTSNTNTNVFVCPVCTPAAPDHIEQLASCIEAVIVREQQQSSSRGRRGPLMPSRMSLRRTKQHTNVHNLPSCSSSGLSASIKTEIKIEFESTNTASSRQDLNLKTPRKHENSKNYIKSQSPIKKVFKQTSKAGDDFQSLSPKSLDQCMSPIKMLEDSLKSKIGEKAVLNEKLVEELRIKFRKPKPLSEKRKIVNDILNGLFDNLLQEPKQKEPVIQWSSPKKCDVTEIIEILDDTPPSKSDKENIKTPNRLDRNADFYHTTPKKSPSIAFRQYNPDCDNYPILHTPKKLKTVEIQKDSSLEISANDEIINIDVIKVENSQNSEFLKKLELKSPEISKKCAFKFSPYNKEVLEAENIDIDMETFKDQYLNEVGLQRVKNETGVEENKLPKKSSKKKNRKRKIEDKELVLKYESKKRKKSRKDKDISIKDKNIQVKIKWRKEQLRLKITDSKKKKKSKKFKQYVLSFSPEKCSTVKPKIDITPIKKRKYIKQEKSPDNLVQTSIQKFFKVKTHPNVQQSVC